MAETKLGIRLVAVYHTLLGVFVILLALIVGALIIFDPGNIVGDPAVTVLVLIPVVGVALGLMFLKIGELTRRLQPNGWWSVMIVNAICLLTANPLAAVILLYMYVMRRDFGIERGFTEMGETEDFIRKLTGILASFAVFPGLGQIVVGRTKLGVKLVKITMAISLVMLIALASLIPSGLILKGPAVLTVLTIIMFALGIIAMFGVWIYSLINVIAEGVVPDGGEDEQG